MGSHRSVQGSFNFFKKTATNCSTSKYFSPPIRRAALIPCSTCVQIHPCALTEDTVCRLLFHFFFQAVPFKRISFVKPVSLHGLPDTITKKRTQVMMKTISIIQVCLSMMRQSSIYSQVQYFPVCMPNILSPKTTSPVSLYLNAIQPLKEFCSGKEKKVNSSTHRSGINVLNTVHTPRTSRTVGNHYGNVSLYWLYPF